MYLFCCFWEAKARSRLPFLPDCFPTLLLSYFHYIVHIHSHLHSSSYSTVFTSQSASPNCETTLLLIGQQFFNLCHNGSRPLKASRPACVRYDTSSSSLRSSLCRGNRKGGSTHQERAWAARLQCRDNLGTQEGGHARVARGPRSYPETAPSCRCGSDQERRNCI